jgi:hypothetical protein
MKAFLAAVVFAVVAAVVAANVLDSTYQQPSHSAFSTDGARVGNPGSNLTGQ